MALENKKQGFSIFNALVLSVMALATAMVLCSCSPAAPQSTSSSDAASSASTASDAQAAVGQYDVLVTVTSPEGPDAINFSQQIPVAADATALDALQATELNVTVTEGPYGAFVEAIGAIANEGTSGWTYTVNGEQPQVSAGEYIVNDGDTVAWSYKDMAE